MTVHLFLSVLTFGLLCLTLWRLTRCDETPSSVSWVPLALAVVLVMPVSFGPVIPITHFVFEATSDNITWYIILGAMLWMTAGYLLWRNIRKHHLAIRDLAVLGTIWATMMFWYGLGLCMSEYEPGVKTPAVTDTPIYLIHWASVHLVLLCLFFLLTVSRAYRRSWLRMVITCVLFVSYLMLLVGAIGKLSA